MVDSTFRNDLAPAVTHEEQLMTRRSRVQIPPPLLKALASVLLARASTGGVTGLWSVDWDRSRFEIRLSNPLRPGAE
jgi:hypothetical protein